MGKPITVKEYDMIGCNEQYDAENYTCIEEQDFENLKAFIHEFTADAESVDVLEFLRIGYKRNIGEIITIKNYVGLIQMKDGFQIQVLPKISFIDGEDKNDEQTKKIFLRMLRSMKDFPGKAFSTASLQVDKMNLYELFINMYLQEVRRLVKIGLKSAYVTTEDNLSCFKGKLQVSQHIRHNLAHKEQFYVAYDEYSQNRPENRLIKATLLKLQKLTDSAENAKEIRQLLIAFENVVASTNHQKDFSQVIIDRSTKAYADILVWSKIFLTNKSFTTFSGSTTSRALLFPMESVYESYVAQQLKKTMCPVGWEVSTQDKGQYLFYTENERKFALRPDIVMTKADKTIVVDTKWKRLNDNPQKNYGISQADMYQMYAYSKKYKADDIWLLYPLNEEMKEYQDCGLHFNSGDSGIKTQVHIFFVDVANIEESLEQLKDMIS